MRFPVRINPIHNLGSLLVAIGLFAAAANPVVAMEPEAVSPIMVPSPGSDLWRTIRQREGPGAGNTRVQGVETGVLIETSGEDFRNYRRQEFTGNAGWFIVGVATAVGLFYLVRGRIPVPGGLSGRKIRRFADLDRIAHWSTAILFIILGLTGLLLLFGRFLLLPVMGPEAFGLLADLAKTAHNLLSPLFLVSLVVLIARFLTKNLFARGDLQWLIKGGGIVGETHVSAGFFNTGEKIWFWAVVLLGIIICISGLVLFFPIFGLGREIMQLALIVHGIASVLFIAGSFGHIYIGTLGTEASLASMTTGYVDENWAKAHHDRWYKEVMDGTSAPDNEYPEQKHREIRAPSLESSATKT